MTNPAPPEVEPPSSTWSRPFLTLVGMLIAYYAYPVELSETAPVIVVVSLAGTVGGLLLGWAMSAMAVPVEDHGCSPCCWSSWSWRPR